MLIILQASNGAHKSAILYILQKLSAPRLCEQCVCGLHEDTRLHCRKYKSTWATMEKPTHVWSDDPAIPRRSDGPAIQQRLRLSAWGPHLSCPTCFHMCIPYSSPGERLRLLTHSRCSVRFRAACILKWKRSVASSPKPPGGLKWYSLSFKLSRSSLGHTRSKAWVQTCPSLVRMHRYVGCFFGLFKSHV